nr:hypothetical protein [Tanacetum cinerariifolium]
LSTGETEALEADKPTHVPRSRINIPLSQTHLRRAQKTVRPEPPMLASMEACILGPIEYDLRRFKVEQAIYGITDTWDEIVDKMIEIALTTLEGVNRE